MSTASFQLVQGDPSTWGIPAEGKTFVGINTAGLLTLKQNDGTIITLATNVPGFSSVVNSSGTTTISPTTPVWRQIVDIQNSPREIPIVLDVDGAVQGSVINLLLKFPDADGYTAKVYNASGSGTLLAQITNSNDPTIVTAGYTFVFTDGAWVLFSAVIPAY